MIAICRDPVSTGEEQKGSRRILCRNRDAEGRALPYFALHLNPSMEEVEQPLGYTQAQAHASMTPGKGALRLTKRLKDKRKKIFRYPHSRILDLYLDLPSSLNRRDRDLDRAAIGEFNRVENDVAENFFDLDLVRLQSRKRRLNLPAKLHLLAAEPGMKQHFQFLPDIFERELLHANDNLTSFDPGEIQETGNQIESLSGITHRRLQALFLTVIEFSQKSPQKDIEIADDDVDRRAQLMGHGGEEFRLNPTSFLQPLVQALHLIDQPGMIDHNRNRTCDRGQHVQVFVVKAPYPLADDLNDAFKLVPDPKRHAGDRTGSKTGCLIHPLGEMVLPVNVGDNHRHPGRGHISGDALPLGKSEIS